MVLANPAFTQAIRQFAQREDFKRLFQITDEQEGNQRNVEYVVRLIAHTFADFDRTLDVQEFLDSVIVNILTTKDPDEVMTTIIWLVETLHRTLGERALFPPANAPGAVAPRFSLRALEAIAVGLARNKNAIAALGNVDEYVRDRITTFWQQPEVPDMSASGLRGTVRIQRTVPFGAQWFNPNA